MKIENSALLSIDSLDLTTDGLLDIPEGVIEIADDSCENVSGIKKVFLPDSLKSLGLTFAENTDLEEIYFGTNMKNYEGGALRGCNNVHTVQIPASWPRFDDMMIFGTMAHTGLKLLIRNFGGYKKFYKVEKHKTSYYNIKNERRLSGTEIKDAQRLHFNGGDISGKSHKILKYKGETFISDISEKTNSDLFNQVRMYKQTLILSDLINKYNDLKDLKPNNYAIRTLKKSIHLLFDRYNNSDRKSIRKNTKLYQELLPEFMINISSFISKYSNSNNLLEIYEIDLERLYNIIFPIQKTANQSGTKYLKTRPLPDSAVREFLKNKSGNSGSFPYPFLENINYENRSELTKKLHELFKYATIKLYTSGGAQKDELDNIIKSELLSEQISELIKKDINICVFKDGTFGKTFLIEIGNNKYIWKLYHSNHSCYSLEFWDHDTEIQNAFLVANKKYHGKIKFGNVFAGNISTQRGERYLITKYEDGQTHGVKCNPYNAIKRFKIIDFENNDNCINNKIIDFGGIEINTQYYDYPFMSKIVNTIVDRSWDDLAYVLNNYNATQIKCATDFIHQELYKHADKHKVIFAKLQFLNNKIYHKLNQNSR